MDLWFWLLQVVLVCIFVYFYHYRPNLNYWPSRGLTGPTPLPFIGNYIEQSWKGQAGAEMDWWKKYGKVYGSFQVNNVCKPGMTILDHELIKQVLAKDFHAFINRRKYKLDHEIWFRNLACLVDDDWKRVRTICSPTFSSAKLRGMHLMMNRCIDKMAENLDKLATEGDGVFKTMQTVSGFTIDVIASTMFATETNTNGDKANQSPLVEHAMKVFVFPLYRVLIFMLVPRSIRMFFGMNLVHNPVHFNFFCDLLKTVVKQRRNESEQITAKRNDFVQLLMDAEVSESDLKSLDYQQLSTNDDHLQEAALTQHLEKKTDSSIFTKMGSKLKKRLDENEIIGQCMIFFTAGFGTTAATLTYFLYEMAQNAEIQRRLSEECERTLDGMDPNSEAYLETVVYKIPYLEACIKETLRKYPPGIRLERTVTIDQYKLAGVQLKKDDLISIPAYVVHRIPEYYPDPERFNPERFMPENKHLLVPYTFLPFGDGPRNCIGQRFALQEMKLLFAKLIQRFHFSPTDKTPNVIEFSRGSLLIPLKEFPLKVEKRVL